MATPCPAARLFLLISSLLGTPLTLAQITWLRPDSELVSAVAAFETAESSIESWTGRVMDSADPYVVFATCSINAEKHPYIYLHLSCTSGRALQLYYSGTGSFSELNSARVLSVRTDGQPRIYRLNLGGVASWRGKVQHLRLDVDGARVGSAFTILGIGTSAIPIDTFGDDTILAPETVPVWGNVAPREPRERMAAWHRTNVVVDEVTGNAALLTYIRSRYTWAEHSLLAKIVPGIRRESQLVTTGAAETVKVEDFPGGVASEITIADTRITAEFVPLCIGRDMDGFAGAAVYSLQTNPPAPVVLRIGAGAGFQLIYGSDNAGLRFGELRPIAETIDKTDDTVIFRSGIDNLPVMIRTAGMIEQTQAADGGATLSISFAEGSGRLLLTFGDTPERAAELAKLDVTAERARVAKTYETLLASRIETPEVDLDNAFRTAIYNLEYTWIEPYGWLECIHHWVSMWHMHAAAGAEWLGQTDRSRRSALAHAERLLPSGAAPQLAPFGQVHRDFGGSNQFWAWHVRRLWRMTGDVDFARSVSTPLDRVLAQTFEEYDTDDDWLLGWGKQVGNQEDFIDTPFDGATPTIEGINMMRTRAALAEALGDAGAASRWRSRMTLAQQRLRTQLWQDDLGRFAYYRDPHGCVRHDGQYHTLIYPIIWDVVDALDGWTGMRHLADRLMGAEGEVYCSANFPAHVPGTWGMQAGAAQQPWAAWGFAAAGMRNETYRPLLAVARWVMDENKRGAWPEISIESTPCYFSPPAGLYIAAVVEALFGLQLDRPAGVLTIAPSFPDDWPHATLMLPQFTARYTRNGNRYTYTVTSETPLARHLRWKLPIGDVRELRVNGAPVEFVTTPGVEHIVLAADTPAARETEFVMDFSPLGYSIAAPGSVAEGDTLRVSVEGLRITAVDDRGGVLACHVQQGDSTIRATVRRDLLAPYREFGRLGLLNFSRRTFFLHCISPRDIATWLPVTVAVLPRLEVAPVAPIAVDDDGVHIGLRVRNNTSRALAETATLHVAGQDTSMPLSIPARSEEIVRVDLPKERATGFALGDNRVTLTLPTAQEHADLTLTTGPSFQDRPTLRDHMQARLKPCSLDTAALVSDEQWKTMRRFDTFMHLPWVAMTPALEALGDQNRIVFPELPVVPFELTPRQFIPVAWKVNRPTAIMNLHDEPYRKLYILLASFLSNSDMFAQVARITVRGPHGILHARTLHFPGDVDWFLPPSSVGAFASCHEPRSERYALLPLRTAGDDDWSEGRAPGYPQPEMWSRSRACITDSAVFSIIELDLGGEHPIKDLVFESLGVDPSFGILAITGDKNAAASTSLPLRRNSE